MKEFDENNNNHFYHFSENNIVNSNTNNLILSFESHSSKENDIFDDNSKNESYKIVLGKYNEVNNILSETNKITTSKYNWINIIPKILMEQFSRICNVYLLIIALFQSIKSISYTDGTPLVLIPFSAIILLNGFKDFLEDKKRKKSDYQENNNEILIYNKNSRSFTLDIWENIKLGDIIKVKEGNQFPCDLIFIQSSPEAKGQCNVDTKNINGETNLHTKKINPKMNFQNLSDINYLCITKKPNEHIYEFEAVFHGITNNNNILNINKKEPLHFNYDNFILRGSSLRQTQYIIGIAVYIGHNTKSMRNSPSATQKISKLEKLMNFQILFIFIFQVVLSIIASIINVIIFYSNNSFIDKFVNIAENNDSFMLRFIKIIGTWTLLLTNFVPIPLLTSLEFIKFFQAMFISQDTDMINKDTLAKVKVQSSTLNDELGQISYIFTDKTGTLTKNNMRFKAFSVGEKSFGNINVIAQKEKEGYELRDRHGKITNIGFIDQNNELRDELINNGKIGNNLLEHLFLNIILNNSAIINRKKFEKKKEIEYLCSSSDEKCLLNFARFCGYTFVDRTVDNAVTLEKIVEQTKIAQMRFNISNTFEFTSERQRMSVIIKSKDNQGKDNYLLYIKGSDYMINKKIANKNTNTYKYLTKKIKQYSEKGLRILVFGYKMISQEEYNEFEKKYKEIIYNINHKEEESYDLYDELETGIHLLGVTAIEDELQDNVENTINKFTNIGIKICMLTGDKIETAKSIASNCNLTKKNVNFINLIHPYNTIQKLENNLQEIYTKIYTEGNPGKKYCLIVTGEVFFKIVSNQQTINLFSKLFDLSESIICCRVSPKQKAQIVHIIKDYNPEKLALAIGDGANDVGMILEADVGVGIQGKEGVEAARASDYSLPEFCFLQKLLLYHGREDYRRNSYYIIYEFYKNIVFTSPFIYFGFYSFFSGESFYDSLLIQFFDMIYSVFPMFYFAIFDKEYDNEVYTKKPELYLTGLKNQYFNTKLFWKELFIGFVEGLAITVNAWVLYEYNNEGFSDNDIISLGVVVFSGVVIAVNVKVLTRASMIDFILVIAIIFGVGSLYLSIFLESLSKSESIRNLFDKIDILDMFSKASAITGCNDYIINKIKYFLYFLFVVFFTCFFDIMFNRINFCYIKNICKKNKSFLFFKTSKYLIDGVNEGVFDEEYKIEKKNMNIIENIDNNDNDNDDCQLLKINNHKKDEISTSLNDIDE